MTPRFSEYPFTEERTHPPYDPERSVSSPFDKGVVTVAEYRQPAWTVPMAAILLVLAVVTIVAALIYGDAIGRAGL